MFVNDFWFAKFYSLIFNCNVYVKFSYNVHFKYIPVIANVYFDMQSVNLCLDESRDLFYVVDC